MADFEGEGRLTYAQPYDALSGISDDSDVGAQIESTRDVMAMVVATHTPGSVTGSVLGEEALIPYFEEVDDNVEQLGPHRDARALVEGLIESDRQAPGPSDDASRRILEGVMSRLEGGEPSDQEPEGADGGDDDSGSTSLAKHLGHLALAKREDGEDGHSGYSGPDRHTVEGLVDKLTGPEGDDGSNDSDS